MKAKLNFLIKQSLKKKMESKWFKAANIIILVLLIGIVNIDHIISFFGGDFLNTTTIYVEDNISCFENLEEDFKNYQDSLEDLDSYSLVKIDNSIEKIDEIENTDNIILSISYDENNYLKANVISYNPISTITEALLQNSLNNIKSAYVLEYSGLSLDEVNSLTSNVIINKEVTNSDADNNDAIDIISSGLIVIFIIPFFMLITMLTQMIGAEINDEKSTRGMEIIISNVSPKIHFLSKIISSTLFVLAQATILAIDVLIAFLVRKLLGGVLVNSEVSSMLNDTLDMLKNSGILSLIIKGLPFIILLFLFSFLAYAIVAGVFASMTTNIEDYQQLQTPLMILLMVGYYIAIMASTFEGSLFVKIVAYIPMLSFLVAPVIYLLGQFSLLELLISTIICGIVTYLFFYFGLRIYKVGILNYSSKNLWKKIFKSVREK